MTTWADDTFTNINSGGSYWTVGQYGSDTWAPVDPPPGIKENYGFGSVISVRQAAAVGAVQYVKVITPDVTREWMLKLRCSATPAADDPKKNGYTVVSQGPYLIWYDGGANQVHVLDRPAGMTGPGTVELRVSAAHAVTLLVNGVPTDSFDYAATPVTGLYQGFGSASQTIVTYAEGGDVGAAATVPAQVTGVTAVGVTATRIDVAWDAPDNGGAPITGYKISRAPNASGAPGTWTVLVANTGGPSPRTYSDTTVTAGTWWYRVSAINSVGEGVTSVPVSGLAVDPPPPAFSDTFTGGLKNWTISRWRSEGDQANNPGHVGSSSNDDFHYDGVLGTHTTPVGAGLLPPYDIFVGTNDWLYVGGGSQNYGDTFLRCAQKMDMTGSGPWKIRLGFIPNLDGSDPGGYGLMGWSTLYATDLPQPSPSMEMDNSHGPIPRHGFAIRLDGGVAANGADGTFHPVPAVLTYTNYVETTGINDPGHAIFGISTSDIADVVVTYTRTNLRITANGVTWLDRPWSLPAALTSAWLYLGAHNHATRKYPPHPDSRSAVYSYINFDGPVIAPQYSYAVADSLRAESGGAESSGLGGTCVGWYSPTGPLTIPAVPANVSSARLLMSVHWTPGFPDNGASYIVRYSLNGNATHDEYAPYLATSGSFAYGFSINPAELVIGDNTVNIQLVGQVGSFAPYVGNISLLVESFSVGKALLGDVPVSRLAVGNTAITKLAIGSTEIWRAPVPPRVPSAPTLITTLPGTSGQLLTRWSLPVDNGAVLSDYTVQWRLPPVGTFRTYGTGTYGYGQYGGSLPEVWTTFAHTPQTTRTLTITGLAAGTAYEVRIAAVNSVGTGGWSNVIRATTA